MTFRTWIRDNCFRHGYVPSVGFVDWLVSNQMWGRAAILLEEMGMEYGRMDARLNDVLVEEYSSCLWQWKINVVDVRNHVNEVVGLIVDKYEEKYHSDCNLIEMGGV